MGTTKGAMKTLGWQILRGSKPPATLDRPGRSSVLGIKGRNPVHEPIVGRFRWRVGLLVEIHPFGLRALNFELFPL
jgi:hypothetical protein